MCIGGVLNVAGLWKQPVRRSNFHVVEEFQSSEANHEVVVCVCLKFQLNMGVDDCWCYSVLISSITGM